MDAATQRRSPMQRRRRWIIATLIVAIVAIAAAIAVTSLPLGQTPSAGDASSPSSPATSPPAPGPSPQGTPVDGSEVLPPVSGAPSTGVPRMTPAPPLWDGPAPETDAAEGRLVKGYPVDLAGPLQGDTVVSSSVTSQSTTLQAALTARSPKSLEDVRSHFAELWSDLGLAKQSDEDAQLAYGGRAASMSLTVTTGGTGTTYVVFAVIEVE